MSNERYNRQMRDLNRVSGSVRGAYAMTAGDSAVSCDFSEEDCLVTLPSVSEAAGMLYVVRASTTESGSGTFKVLITHAGDSSAWEGDVELINAGAVAVFLSDGEGWHMLSKREGAVPVAPVSSEQQTPF